MADKAKASGLIIPIILILLSLSLAGGGFYLYKKEQSLNLGLQQELNNIKTKLTLSEKEYEEAQKKISVLDMQLGESQTEVDKLKKQLDDETAAKEQSEKMINDLKTDLSQQKMLKAELEKQFNQSRNDLIKVQNQIKDLESQKNDLEVKLKEMEEKYQEGIELGKIVVTSPSGLTAAEVIPEPVQVQVEPVQAEPVKIKSVKFKKNKAVKFEKEIVEKAPAIDKIEEVRADSPAGQKGSILVVNKDYNYVVINLGNEEGVRLGDLFSIYHKNKYIGDVKVAKVHDSLSAADFVMPEIKDKINEGDVVVKKIE